MESNNGILSCKWDCRVQKALLSYSVLFKHIYLLYLLLFLLLSLDSKYVCWAWAQTHPFIKQATVFLRIFSTQLKCCPAERAQCGQLFVELGEWHVWPIPLHCSSIRLESWRGHCCIYRCPCPHHLLLDSSILCSGNQVFTPPPPNLPTVSHAWPLKDLQKVHIPSSPSYWRTNRAFQTSA